MNEVKMNNEAFEERSKNISNLQTKTNRISQIEDEKTKIIISTIA
jgi:hypothetical protein